MSLDINWIVIAIIFTALVIEVLTVVAYVFENHWSFDEPRTRTSRSDVFQGLVPDAYTGVWTADAIGAVTQSSDTVLGAVDPAVLPPSQKPRPLPRTRPVMPRPGPDGGPFAGFIARFSSWASTFAKRTTVTAKPKHSAGNLETSTLAPTGTRPATGTCITTDSGVITQCPELKRSLKSLTYLSGVAALQGIKVQAPVDALTRISLSAPITRNVVATEIISPLAKTKVLKVHEVKKTRISVYQLPPPSDSLSPRAFDQAKPPAATERYVQPLSKAPIKLNVPARLPCYSAPNLAAASYKRHSAKASATSASVIIIPPEPEDWDKKISSKVEVTKTRLELKEPELVSGSAAPPIVDLEPQRPVQESPPVPTFAPNTEPVPVIPSKRRLRTGATRATRPIKRRRLVSPEDQDVPQSDQVGTDVLTVADISPNYSHPKLANSPPSPSPILPPVSPSLTASATSTSGFFIAPTEPDLWQEKKQFEVDSSDVPSEEPRDVTVSCQSISGDTHPKSDLHVTQESHFFAAAIPTLNTVPVEPTALSPPRCLVPAKRCAPAKFQPNLFQTKRRRITPTEIREFHTPLPTSAVADLPPLSLSQTEPKTTQLFTVPTIDDPSPPSEPSFRPSTSQNPVIQAPSLITRLVELTRDEAKSARTLIYTSDKSNSRLTSALGSIIDTRMSSSGKPGAPSCVHLRAPIMPREIVGEKSNDVDMVALDSMATPDVTMSASTPDTSLSSIGSAPTSPVAFAVEAETMLKVPKDRSLVDEEDVEMDPDSLMSDSTRSGYTQRQHRMSTTSGRPASTQVTSTSEDTEPMEQTGVEVTPEETMKDTTDTLEQEGVPELVMEEPANALARPAEAPQQLTNLAQNFAGMQVQAAGVTHPGEHAAAPQELEPEPVAELAQVLGAMQVSAQGEADAHTETPSESATIPAEPTTLDVPHPLVNPEEYVEDPLDELIQGLITTHLPAPVIVPYVPESTEIGVNDTVSGPTGSDFISLGFEDDGEEFEGEEDEQTLMDATAEAVAWISGL